MPRQKKLSAEKRRGIRIDGAKGLTREPVQNLQPECTDFHGDSTVTSTTAQYIERAYDPRNASRRCSCASSF